MIEKTTPAYSFLSPFSVGFKKKIIALFVSKNRFFSLTKDSLLERSRQLDKQAGSHKSCLDLKNVEKHYVPAFVLHINGYC